MGIWLHIPNEDSVPTAVSQIIYIPARVEAIISDNTEEDYEHYEGQRQGSQELEVKLLSGEHKGEVLSMTNYLGALFNVDVKKDDRVIVRLHTNEDGSYYVSMYNYDRGVIMGIVLLLFVAVLVVLGGKKGARALAGLALTLLCIWQLLIPGLIRGFSALPYTIFLVAVVTIASLILLNGFSPKTLCAAVGCIGGVTIAAMVRELSGLLHL
ncbi:MAG: YibE/F family protein [bacterium]|nr:YibE/F family protein [bacterium]